MRETEPFSSRLALVTGASLGIGAATAEALAAGGAHVILVARTSSALEQVEERIHEAGGSGDIAPLDLTQAITGAWQLLKRAGPCPATGGVESSVAARSAEPVSGSRYELRLESRYFLFCPKTSLPGIQQPFSRRPRRRGAGTGRPAPPGTGPQSSPKGGYLRNPVGWADTAPPRHLDGSQSDGRRGWGDRGSGTPRCPRARRSNLSVMSALVLGLVGDHLG